MEIQLYPTIFPNQILQVFPVYLLKCRILFSWTLFWQQSATISWLESVQVSEADGEMAHHHVIRDSNYFLNREGVHYRGQVAGTRATGDTGPDMSDTFCFINIATDRSDTPLITALTLTAAHLYLSVNVWSNFYLLSIWNETFLKLQNVSWLKSIGRPKEHNCFCLNWYQCSSDAGVQKWHLKINNVRTKESA